MLSLSLFISNQSPDILKPELPLHGKENKKSKGNSGAVQLFDDCTGKLDCVTPGSSAREFISKLLDEALELAIELPITVKCDGGTPVRNEVSRDVKEKSREPETDRASSSFVQCNEDNPGAADYFENKTNLRKICRIEQSEEVAGCDWVSLVSDAVLNSNLSIVENNSEDQDEKTVDTGAISFISTVLQLPQDEITPKPQFDSNFLSEFASNHRMIRFLRILTKVIKGHLKISNAHEKSQLTESNMGLLDAHVGVPSFGVLASDTLPSESRYFDVSNCYLVPTISNDASSW
ncbi:hypothetical protein KPL70_015026 [Citrus sinensis]|nr:hypothetical protein KPL70_015026 [Citrus sinensis]